MQWTPFDVKVMEHARAIESVNRRTWLNELELQTPMSQTVGRSSGVAIVRQVMSAARIVQVPKRMRDLKRAI